MVRGLRQEAEADGCKQEGSVLRLPCERKRLSPRGFILCNVSGKRRECWVHERVAKPPEHHRKQQRLKAVDGIQRC